MNASPAGPGLMDTLPMLVVPIVIFYLLVFRPQLKARKDHEEMLKQLKKNDQVVTSGGVIGTVVNVKPETVTLRVDDNVRLEVERSAVVKLLKAKAAGDAAAKGA